MGCGNISLYNCQDFEDDSAVKCMLVFFYHAYNLKRRNKFVRPIINAIVTLELFLEHLLIVAILQNVSFWYPNF